IRMLELGCRLGLELEAPAMLGSGQETIADHFQSHVPLCALLPGLVHDAHGAAAQLVCDLVTRNTRPILFLTACGGLGGRLSGECRWRIRDGRGNRELLEYWLDHWTRGRRIKSGGD